MKFIYLFIVLLLSSCSNPPQKDIKIALNSWIGYTPFIYASQEGWLRDTSIEIIPVVSLMESVKLMESGIANAMGGTQQEFNHLLHSLYIEPSFLLNFSSGADAVFSNLTIAQLKNTHEKIDIYMEKGSVNELMLDFFVKNNDLNISSLNKINADQHSISRIKHKKTPTILISYEPYLKDISRNGYKILANSNDLDYMIFDALFVKKDVLDNNKEEFKKLHKLILKALDVLETNPQKYYEKVKAFLDSQTYDEFKESLQGVQWLDNNTDKELMKKFSSLKGDLK